MIAILKLFLMFISTHAWNYFKPFDPKNTAAATIEVAALNMGDLFITLIAIYGAGATEANPMMAWILGTSLLAFCLLKILASLILYRAKDEKLGKFSTFGISFDLVVYRTVIVWNILTFIQKVIGL